MREWLESKSEIKFPSTAFCQVESFPYGILQIGPRDGNLQAHCFDDRPVLDRVLGGVLGFVRFVFGVHGILFFLFGLWLYESVEILRNKSVSSMG